MSRDLEQRYRRVLRVLPRYYRDTWEDDMVAAFMDSWLLGDPESDAYVMEVGRPELAEVASVFALAIRLYLGGASTPRRYFAWGQAVRRAVLAVALFHAQQGLTALILLAWTRRVLDRIAGPPAGLVPVTPNGPLPPTVWYVSDGAWVVVLVALALGRIRTARAFGLIAILPDLVQVVDGQIHGYFAVPPFGPWGFWILLNLVPVLAMAAFHRDAPQVPRLPWLLALPVIFVAIDIPWMVVVASGNADWLPDDSGLFCLLIALACVVRALIVRSGRTDGSGVWSLTLMLLAALAGTYRIVSLSDYVHDPHLIYVSLAELAILAVATGFVVPDAIRAQATTPARPPNLNPG